MKKIFIPIMILFISMVALLPGMNVSAKSAYESTLYIPEDSAMLGKDRWYDTGTFTVEVAIDKHLGSNPNALEKLWNVLFYYPSNRQVAGVMTGSKLYTCTYGSFGKWNNGRYQFGFVTGEANGTVYKGVQSSSVWMKSR